MRKLYTIVIGIFLTFLFTACKQFTANIDDYLGYWAAEAFIKSASIEAAHQTDVTGIASVASEKDVAVTLKVQNPKAFKFIMPSASETRNIVGFTHFSGTKPAVGAEYEIKQLAADTLRLVYKTSFLKNAEWGEKNLSSTITLIADDGRVFKQTFTVPLKANTPPPKPSFTVVKTKGTPAYYVLGITVPDMNKTVPGGRLHKDITRIKVNGTEYAFSVDEAQNRFVKPESAGFITRSEVEKLTEPGAEEVPSGGWVLYYKTDVEAKDGAAKKDYTIKLTDAKGLVSPVLNASTKPNKAEAEIISITKGTKISGSGSETDPAIIGTDSSGAEIRVSSGTANTTVHCTLTDTGSTASSQYNGNPVTVPLPLSSADEKTYKLEYYTDGEGFAATAVKTVYYKVVKGHTVTFNANGGTYPGGTTEFYKNALHGTTVSEPDPHPKKKGYTVGSWHQSADGSGTAWNFTTNRVTRDITLYAKWVPGTDTVYTVEHYKQNIGDDEYTLAETESKTGTTNALIDVNAIKKEYQGFNYERMEPSPASIDAEGNTVVKLYYKREQYNVNFSVDGSSGGSISVTAVTGGSVPLGSPATVKHDGSVTFAANPDTVNGYEVEKWTVDGSEVSGHTSTTYTLSNVTGNKIVKVTFKKTTYKVTFRVDGANGTLTAEVDGTEIHSGDDVEKGKTVSFTATAASGWEVEGWTFNGNAANGTSTTATLIVNEPKIVTVKFKAGVFNFTNPLPPDAWKKLREEAEKPTGAHTITIYYANINAPAGEREITPGRDLTIKGVSAGLIANGNTRIFKVKDGKKLTLENIELIAGQADKGGAVYNEGTLIMKGEVIISPSEGGAGKNDVYLRKRKTITLDDGFSPEGNEAVARITLEEYRENAQVLTGNKVSTYYNRFTVTPENGTDIPWYINNSGRLATDEVEVENENELEAAINGATPGRPRLIKVTSSFASKKSFIIANKKIITIKAAPGITLTCKKVTTDHHKHFHVKSGKLTFSGNITLQGDNYGHTQYALYVEGGTAEIKDNVIITGFSMNPSGYTFAGVYTNARLIMSGGTIKNGKAQHGGGVYIEGQGVFTMTGGTITGNTANHHGRALWIRGTFNWKGGTITGNPGTGDVLHTDSAGSISNDSGNTAS